MRVLGDRYVLDTRVGRGGMAEVWRAHDDVLGRTVAVKLLAMRLVSDSHGVAQIRREALTAAKLCHPHIAGVHDYGEAVLGGQRLPYVVMEYVDGPTLAKQIADGGALSWPGALRIGAQVADALAEAHSHGLVHRDVKPSNVMLPRTGVKVVDFGVAAPAGQSAADTGGRIWGTPGYLPPEQLAHGAALPAGDVYALGLLLHECLTGRPPWPGPTARDVLAQRRRQPTPDPPGPAGLPGEVVDLYHRCLAPEPEDRPSARQVAAALHTWAEADTTTSLITSQRPTAPVGAHRPTVPQADPRTGRRDTRRHFRRRAAALLSAPLAVAVGLLAMPSWDAGAPEQAQAERAVPAADAEAGCRASFTSTRRADGSFSARLMVTNTGAASLRDWSVAFVLPQGQAITDIPRGQWSQDGERVIVAAADALRPGATAALSMRGRFDPARAGVPAGFAVDDVECAQAVTRIVTSPTPPSAAPQPARRNSGDNRADRPGGQSDLGPLPATAGPRTRSSRPGGNPAPIESPPASGSPAPPTAKPPSTPPTDDPTTNTPAPTSSASTTPTASPGPTESPSSGPDQPSPSADPDPPRTPTSVDSSAEEEV